MMKEKKAGRVLLSFLLTLAMVVGLMPGMSLTAYAAGEKAYAAYDVTTETNKTKSGDDLKALQVTFNDRKWYIIEDNSSSATSGTVTLLSADTSFGIKTFDNVNNSNKYSTSQVKTYLDSMTGTGGAFADVAEAIKTVDLTTNKYDSTDVYETVDGVKLYLLSTEEAKSLPVNVRKAGFTGENFHYNEWWLRSPGFYDDFAAFVYGDEGSVPDNAYNVKDAIGVRPALKLDLSKVTFDSDTNTFTMGIPTVDVASVTLNKNSATLSVGDTETLTVTVSPDNATDKTITWSSDNTAVATVSNGVVTAVGSGTANITVTAINGTDDASDDKTATCAVTVNAASSSGDSSDSGSGSSSGSSDSGNTSGGTSSGSSDNTNTNTDTSAKVPYEEVAISTGSVTDITGTAAATAESNPFGTKIENSSNLTTLLSLTDAEVAQGVNVWLDVQDMSSSVSKTDKSKIEKKSGDYTVGMYLDINLFKKVGNNDATKVSETNGKIKASIVIPKKLRKSGRTFEIIRVHNGKAATITGKYNKKTHVFTFETDKFSTYAIAYKDASSSTDTESSDSSSSTTTSTTTTTTASTGSTATTATAPKTGDASDMRVWLMFVIVSFAGLGVYAVSRKKRASK